MKKLLLRTLLLALPGLLFSCKNDPSSAAEPVALESLKKSKMEGPDCEKPDSLRTNCAKVSLSYPSVEEGSEVLKKNVADWSQVFLAAMLAPASDPNDSPAALPLDSLVAEFIAMHKQFTAEMPDALSYYVVEVWDTVLLNDGRHLTLKLDGYSYAGGAHPSPAAAVATWDAATGKQVMLEDLVADLPALQKVAERKFREVKADIFKPESEGGWGFKFDEVFPFKLADNTGLTAGGIYFCYVPYEVGPYAMGATEFVIPFEEIKSLLK